MSTDWRDELRAVAACEDVGELIALSKSKHARVRLAAAKEMCPCHVGRDIEELWLRLFEMASDSDASVRKQVMHDLCDGSPGVYEERVMDAVDQFNRDSDKSIRRMAHKVLASYHRTGKWNVL
eukprot:PLAT14781.1.p2 GENE.PLAT14781.1~~PLAT14781.1.p2  ORF type:complete len:123 (-),score=62.76 PLAT14781.1:211-579(-)